MVFLSINDINAIMHYLTDASLDRIYLNEFKNVDSITTSNDGKPVLLSEPIYHENCFLLENTSDVIFKFNFVDMRKFNKLEITILSDVSINLDDVSLYFSEFANANIPLEKAKLNKDETIIKNNLYSFVFEFKDEEGALYYLPSIKSIKLDFGKELDYVKIANIMIKANTYSLSLDELKPALDDAEKYIIKRIEDYNLPSILEDEVPKKAASMLWLIARQEKGESNVGAEGMRFSPSNFHDKTKKEVDDAISTYNSENGSDNSEKTINENLVGSI